MEPNITNETHFDDDLPLSEPHFDEEATLLSAQPVVALTDIEAKGRTRKRLAFGAAMFFSIIAGALGATFIYKFKNPREAAMVVKGAVPGVTASAASEGLPVANADVDGTRTASIPRAAPAAEVERSKPITVKTAKRTVDEQSQTQLRRQPDETKQLRRRQEREAGPDPRRRRHRSDDLARIREIFEGSQP